MSTILETRGLTHVYGAGTPFERVALDHVDIQINKGEILGVIGHTGSGKSVWYFSIRNISCSRRRLRRTLPTARPT